MFKVSKFRNKLPTPLLPFWFFSYLFFFLFRENSNYVNLSSIYIYVLFLLELLKFWPRIYKAHILF